MSDDEKVLQVVETCYKFATICRDIQEIDFEKLYRDMQVVYSQMLEDDNFPVNLTKAKKELEFHRVMCHLFLGVQNSIKTYTEETSSGVDIRYVTHNDDVCDVNPLTLDWKVGAEYNPHARVCSLCHGAISRKMEGIIQ